MEVRTQFKLPFDQSSLFPSLTLDTILEVEFNLSLHLHMNNFNDIEFNEFMWKYERLVKHFKDKEEQALQAQAKANSK